MEKYVIFHGSFGSNKGNWFPWLKKELQGKGKKVFVPQMPVGVGKQSFESWSKKFDELAIDENTVIIAHSIAPVFVCKYLVKNKIRVRKLIFVCGFNNYLGINSEYDSVNEPMYFDNLEDVKNYCNDITCFYSDNDPYVPYDIEKQFADSVASKQIIVKGGGHINSESGFMKFKELLDYID